MTSALPLAPKNPLPIRQLAEGGAKSRHRAGSAARRRRARHADSSSARSGLFPPVVAVISPNGIRDVLGRNDAFAERCVIHDEVRHMAGDSLFVLPNEQWLPAQARAATGLHQTQRPQLRRPHVRRRHRHSCESWPDSGEVDLDVECRRLTMRSLGRSVLGLDLNERADAIAEHMHVASSYTADRALRPLRAPRWLPTPARAPRPRRGRRDAQRHRRDAAGVPRGSDP